MTKMTSRSVVCIVFTVLLTASIVTAQHCHKDEGCDDTEDVENTEALRLILVGKTGAGKSATGNTILGQKKFKESLLPTSETKKSQLERTVIRGRTVEVMDCPGLFDTSLSQTQVAMEIFRTLAGMDPGPHAFIYVVQAGSYTQEEYDTYQRLKHLFKKATSYMVLVFTHLDDLEAAGISTRDFIRKAQGNLRTVINDCGYRYVFLNNRKTNKKQVNDLLDSVDLLGGKHYINEFSLLISEELASIIERAYRQFDNPQGQEKGTHDTRQHKEKRFEDRQKASSGVFDKLISLTGKAMKAISTRVAYVFSFFV